MFKSLKSKYHSAQKITKNEWLNTDSCNCGKNIFKYHDVSDNVFVAKCSVTKYELDIKTREWVKNKKENCKLFKVHYGERPEYPPILKINKVKPIEDDPNKNLEEKLKNLFTYLLLSNNPCTLQQINYLVKHRLRRLTRIIYYSPTVGHFMNIAEMETLENYKKRIFSRPIIDKSIIKSIVVKTDKENINPEIVVVCSESEESELSDDEDSEHSETGESVLSEKEETELTDTIEDYVSDNNGYEETEYEDLD